MRKCQKKNSLSLVRVLLSQTKRLMILIRHVFSAKIIFDTLEFDGASNDATIEHAIVRDGHHI